MTEIRTSQEINELSAALAKAQAEIENVEKGGVNPGFKQANGPSRYATLGSALEEVRNKFAKEGIAVLQMPVNGEGTSIGVVTRFAHSSGQWIESTIYVAPQRFDAQGAGSVITYLRRYALMAMAGIAPEDDDGNAAVAAPDARPQTNGATRTVAAPPPPEKPAHLNGNGKVLPPHPEESGEATAARQRAKMLVGQIVQIIKTAPDDEKLDLAMDDARDKIKEIEAVLEQMFKFEESVSLVDGPGAANLLRARHNRRIAELRGAK